MNKNVLLLGRKSIIVEDVIRDLDMPHIQFFTGTNLDDVQRIIARHHIHHVIMGAGIDIEVRLQITKTIFAHSDTTTVHMKDYASGAEGMMDFVDKILTVLIPI